MGYTRNGRYGYNPQRPLRTLYPVVIVVWSSKPRTTEQIKSRRKFLQGGVALGATAPILFANNAQAHGSRLKDNMDQEYVIVSIVSTHPFWNDLKNGAQDAADDLGVKFSYVGPAGFDVEGQVQAMEQILIKKPAGIGQVHSTDAAFPAIQRTCSHKFFKKKNIISIR